MKRILKFVLLGIMIGCFSPKIILAKNQFYLEDDPNGLTYIIYKGSSKFFLYFMLVKDVETGELIYCLEPGVALSEELYEELNEWEYSKLDLTEEQKDYITKVAYFGYGYENHQSLNYYYAAQLLIWEYLIPENWSIYYTDSLGGNKVDLFRKEMNEIDDLVFEANKMPSFAEQVFTWNINDTLEIVDINEVLSRFQIEENNKLKLEQNGNSIKINMKNIEEETLNFKKIYEGMPLKFYYREDGQNVLRRGSMEPEEISVFLKPYELKAEIQKIDEKEQVIANVVFGLFAKEEIRNGNGSIVYEKDELINKFTTNSEGKINIDRLWDGSYYLKEISVPEEYVLKEEEIPFVVSNEKEKVFLRVENSLKKQTLIIEKRDEETSKPLANVRFQIFDQNKKLILDVVTDKEGMIVLDELPLGTYYLKEIETILGYQIEHKEWQFVLDGKDDRLSIVITNRALEDVPNTLIIDYRLPILERRREYEEILFNSFVII